MQLKKLEKIAVSALEDKKAKEIVTFDVRPLTALYDTMIIASGDSSRQVKALADHVRDTVKAAGGVIVGLEGDKTAEWVLVDCGDFIVHVMQSAIRTYYNLEELWSMRPAKIKQKLATNSDSEPTDS